VASIHGKSAVLYLGAAGAAAINIGEQLDWSLDFDMATVDVTPLNNTWKTFVKGLQGYSGSFGGNFDTASTQLWMASTSAVAEKFYLYPQSSVTTSYYYGTAWVQLGKIAAGSTTAKASNNIKLLGNGVLAYNG
jgi:hypothetical protein